MKVLYLRATVAAVILASCSAIAQMHKVAKPQQVVRAVGVYEWTGDFAKPTASRLIPVSLYIEGKFEDAGIYVARPVPFALLSGNLYILQDAGVDKGTLDLVYAKHLQAVEPTGDLAFDDGWFGYGTVKPLSAPRKPAALKPSKTLPVITASNDTNRPHFGSKPSGDSTNASDSSPGKPATSDDKSATTTTSSSASTSTSDDPDRPTMKRRSSDTASSGSASGTTADSSSTAGTTGSSTSSTATPADDPDRPTMKRRSADSTTSGSDTTSTTASTSSAGTTPADDPDRPTMKRRTDSTDSTDTDTNTTSTTASNPAPADDPDRPTLKRHTAEDAKKAKISDIASVTGTDSLNDDPNRPNLHHGKPASAMTEADLPKLTGLPPNLHQMVAISDAVNRDPHPFTLAWDDEEEHKAILEKMQAMARAQLAAYGTNPATAAPAATPAAKKTTAPTTARSHRPAPPAPPTPLLDEELKAYTLSYGGAATYVYSANTGGTGAALRYVTIVAQDDGLGNIKPAIQSVTDAAHLNRTPKMKFVDVVDAEASNRASLLFELRSQNARQFALYRVIASHPDQIFVTGTTQ